jgi:ribosomal protein S18 acetylase RimI-like enzyme
MQIRSYRPSDKSSVIDLWHKCDLIRSWNDPEKDIKRKLKVQGEWFLVGTIDDEIMASVMAGYDGHRGWVNYLAVAPEHQKLGFGQKMMAEAEQLLRQVGCPKLNLQLRDSNTEAIKFYQKLRYQIDDVISFGKRLESDE